MALIKLPEPRKKGRISVEEALNTRRSIRKYSGQPLSLQEVGQLLWAAQGITNKKGRRTAPSAGALYPIEVYLVAGEVSNLQSGIYRYIPQWHSLELHIEGDWREKLCTAALNQEYIRDAPASILISAVFDRTRRKYGRSRGARYAGMEAGNVSQNICLQAVVLKLGTVFVGAFKDSKISCIFDMEDDESPLAIMPVGKINE